MVYNYNMKRAIKNSVIFLGIVVLGLLAQAFVTEDSPLVRSKKTTQTANPVEACTESSLC